jgi:16S rRNA (guanine527-N7)-methyltransferase
MNQQNAKAFDRFGQAVPLTDQQRLLLARYIDLVEEWNQRNNLVSANDLFRIAERHLPDSWNFCQQKAIPSNAQVLDLGSGAGFPGVVGAVLRSDAVFTLLDSRRMRALFLKQAVTELRLTNAQVLCQRAESLTGTHAGFFDVVTARAVAGLEELWGWAHPLIKPSGHLVTQKGREEDLSRFAHLSMEKMPMMHTISDSVLVIVKGERSE